MCVEDPDAEACVDFGDLDACCVASFVGTAVQPCPDLDIVRGADVMQCLWNGGRVGTKKKAISSEDGRLSRELYMSSTQGLEIFAEINLQLAPTMRAAWLQI